MLGPLKRNLSECHWLLGEYEFNKLGLKNGDYFIVSRQWNTTFEKCTMFFIQKIKNGFFRFTLNIRDNSDIPFKYYSVFEDE
jgi:hypothetical protein